MTLFRNKYRVESTRLKGWDYSASGYYHVTICAKLKFPYFGFIRNGEMHPSKLALIVRKCWYDLPHHYSNCRLDEFNVMPDHVHGVILIDNGDRDENAVGVEEEIEMGFYDFGKKKNGKPGLVETGHGAFIETDRRPVSTGTGKRYSLFEIIRAFKSFSSRRINEYLHTPGRQFWQSRFFDNIITSDEELNYIRYYVRNNPRLWELKKEKALLEARPNVIKK